MPIELEPEKSMQSCNSDFNHSLAHMTESIFNNTETEWTLKKERKPISPNLNQANAWSKQSAQQDQWTQLLAKITLKIRQSLQLEDILQTTVTEVRELLEADRVLIYRLWPDGTGSGVTEAVLPGWPTVLGQVFEPEVFPQEYHQLYVSGRIRAIKNVENADVSPCMVEFLQQFGVQSKLVVPIVLQEELWGLLVAHQCAHPRQWSTGEIEVLKQLADQVSIALSQAQYQEHLEELVAQRTAKLTTTLERLQQEINERKQAEELLHLREQEFRALVEHSPDLIVRFDPQLRHVYVNPAVERSTGIPRQTFIGKTHQELGMPQEFVTGWNEALLEVLVTGREGMIEFDFPTASGLKFYQARIVPEFAQDGTIRFLLGVTRDITQCKQAEKALQQRLLKEQALHQLVQSIRNSLDLETIFFTAVAEIGKLLPVDRALVVQYLPERKLWLNVADYRASSDLPVALGLETPDEDNRIAARLKHSEVVLIDHTNQCEDEINYHFSQTFPGAGLWVPLHFGSKLWGSLTLFVENRAYAWQDSEVQLALAVAEQLAIAIQQAELLNQSRIATIKAQEQAEALKHEMMERKRTEETLRAIYKVSTARKLSFEQRLQGLLALGRRRFGLEMGALGRVKNNVYEVIAAQVAPKSSFPIAQGTMWNLEQTYCSVTLGTKEPIAFASAGTSSWRHLPAYTSRPVEAYLGMSVVVAGQIYGSLSFFSLQARQHPFTAGDKALLKLMAQWVGALLEHQQSEEELRQSEARFREIAQREALLNQLASQIRRSLDLNTILETAVHEIRNLLQIDRCFFLWYRADATQPVWEVVTEARSPAFPSVIGHCVPLATFGPLTRRVFNKEITRVDNARSLTDAAERKFFFSLGYTAMLALPIHTTSGEIGVVSCGHSTGSRPWREEEVELLEAVADQIAIAIDQAELLEQSRTTAAAAQEQATQLKQALHELQQTQAQLVQSEKMSSLGQLVAGIAHEINNPVNFIYGNLTYVSEYAEQLLDLIQLYQQYYPRPAPEIGTAVAEIDLDFMKEDFPKIVSSMKGGADRIRQIVLSLRNFSRVDEAEMKWVDIHEGIDNSLLILAHRLKAQQPEEPDIQVIKDYRNLPKVQCYAGQLNQVFMNILTNAIDAIESRNACEAIEGVNKQCSSNLFKSHPGLIWICTEVLSERNEVIILISDNGPGMAQEVQRRIFDPFFTTKPVGSGTGLGLSISYQIVVEKHGGRLECISAPGQGTVFLISLPIHQSS
ncbi:GAF domain-containing protein [Microcoleus sp. ZQ-A2]|nr:GAF domain-containing protein [Microcoleus sp. FACHB-1]